MDEEKIIKAAIDYIKTHMPQKTDFETIDVAISRVAEGVKAAANEDLVNEDDAWLIPEEERGKFAGIRGSGWAQGFTKETIRMFYEAVEYSKKHISQYGNINELKEMKEDLVNTVSYDDDNINKDNKDEYDNYIPDYNKIK